MTSVTGFELWKSNQSKGCLIHYRALRTVRTSVEREFTVFGDYLTGWNDTMVV
jgi:hypothetical protein